VAGMGTLEQFIPIAVHTLCLARYSSVAHTLILATSFPLGTPHTGFLQDRTTIREYHHTVLSSATPRIALNKQDTK
jgi:hypothetical protein